MERQKWRALIVVVTAIVGWACDGNSTMAPSETTVTTAAATAAEPTVTEDWAGTVPVGGAAFYSFSMSQGGTVRVTLLSVSGQDVPPTVTLGLGIRRPSGTSCGTTSTTTAEAGSSPQLTGTYDAGLYCARVSDVGNLDAPATVSVSIAHP